MTKWLITWSRRRSVRWNIVEFGGATGSESRGIVDLLAIRKDHRSSGNGLKSGDLFDMVLIQTKGGAARNPSNMDIKRLLKVAAHHRASAVILAIWKKGTSPVFLLLIGQKWKRVDSADIFG